jgi:hypothetical protein
MTEIPKRCPCVSPAIVYPWHDCEFHSEPSHGLIPRVQTLALNQSFSNTAVLSALCWMQ